MLQLVVGTDAACLKKHHRRVPAQLSHHAESIPSYKICCTEEAESGALQTPYLQAR